MTVIDVLGKLTDNCNIFQENKTYFLVSKEYVESFYNKCKGNLLQSFEYLIHFYNNIVDIFTLEERIKELINVIKKLTIFKFGLYFISLH